MANRCEKCGKPTLTYFCRICRRVAEHKAPAKSVSGRQGTGPVPPWVPERVALYTERAALGLPLFGR